MQSKCCKREAKDDCQSDVEDGFFHGGLLDGAEAPVDLDVECWAGVCFAPVAKAFCVLANFEFPACVGLNKEKALCLFLNLQQLTAFQTKVCAAVCCCNFNVCCCHVVAPLRC